MSNPDLIIRNALVFDGSGAAPTRSDVSIAEDRIIAIGPSPQAVLGSSEAAAIKIVDARGLALAPGFIDVHTHDDLAVLAKPSMLPNISQGVTTVITGNCGISAAPVTLRGELPDPMNLLGASREFRYPTFAAYRRAIEEARPAVNVAALVGHTALRSNQMDRLDREATPGEIAAMRTQLEEALDAGALGLSTGLAYLSAHAAGTDEVLGLAAPLAAAGAVYATHMRTEADQILDAMREAFGIGQGSQVPVVISHLKCAGVANWGRSGEVLATLDEARALAACRLRLLSLRGRFQHPRSSPGRRAREDRHHLEHAPSRDGRQDARRDCDGVANATARCGASPSTSRRDLPQHL